MLKRYADLGTVHRGSPCQEYPGEYLVYEDKPEGKETSHKLYDMAYLHARDIVAKGECSASICWKCSDNDPRVGQVWFTGFYQITVL